MVDRFHVAKHYRVVADKDQKAEMKKQNITLALQDYAKLKGPFAHFGNLYSSCLMSSKPSHCYCSNMPPYLLKDEYAQREALTGIFVFLGKTPAEEALNNWLARIKLLGLVCFDTFVVMLNNRRKEITHIFLFPA